MAVSTGSVTLNGSVGIVLTNDAFGLSIASQFQALAAMMATPALRSAATPDFMAAAMTAGGPAQIGSTPNTVYTYDPGSTLLALENNLGNAEVIGPLGSSDLLVGDGTSFFYSGPTTEPVGTVTSASIVGGNGNDTVATGVGDDTVALGAGYNAYLIGVNGTVDSSGNSDTVVGGLGQTNVTVTGASSYVASSEVAGASMSLNAAAASSLTIYNVETMSVLGATGSPMTVTNYGNMTVDAGAAGMTYTQQGGSLLLNGLAGETDNLTVNGGAADTLYGGGSVGTTTINVTGSVAGNVFVANDPAHGGSGSVVFNGASASGGNAFWAGSGNATLIGGAGTDTMVAGGGAVTMTGGAGGSTALNYFDLLSVSGGVHEQVTINDFGAASNNQITLFNYGSSGETYALNHQTQMSGGTVISLSDGSKITLLGVTSSLTSTQIKFT